MKTIKTPAKPASTKAATGIEGFDSVTGGGLPFGRTTLLTGGPGSGKTIFAMQFLVQGAKTRGEPGIFVTFEETASRIDMNFKGFGWGLAALQPRELFLIEAQPAPDLVQDGNFDLGGLLAALQAQVGKMGARRIVFDALDVMLALLPDVASQRREVFRLHEWLITHQLTALITAKADGSHGFMQFMVDCSIILNHGVVRGVSQRSLRVQKYRGSAFDENESPFVIGKSGFEVALNHTPGRMEAAVGNERVASGVARLDTMLGGGYYRGAAVLITGFPGTAKTTLSGAFADAACRRGERTLFLSFDSDGNEIVRNLASVGIRLAPHTKSGLLRVVPSHNIVGSAETTLVRIKALTLEHQARCLVIDPVSTLSTAGNELTAHSVAERLIDWAKAEGITMVCTSLLDELSVGTGVGSPLHISTRADTWIHLSYLVQAGERNRGMSIIKSRGTAHSNQVRELILSDEGVTLADIYTAGGEVLMGTLRWEKESAALLDRETAAMAEKLKRIRLDAEEAVLEVRLKSLQTELVAKQAEKTLLTRTAESREKELALGRHHMRELRRGDAAKTGAKVTKR